ncbi:CDGSH iron-sulfur domain-containing protein [Microlunatus elymi]|uniref:CDGSH iron-sulfur domain-containing protein n=1 Tax=Microlunatus elymi TaxID=2596828 RepID=A0A516PXU6_9ACTN|nr:CDGSH iron-sulfur domain-containing protein [Microlunatus elymi]QDP96000.1 CDGSH iron-sulfur domain-containing protein [Microlunatus elymi]
MEAWRPSGRSARLRSSARGDPVINSRRIDASDACFRCIGSRRIELILSPDGPLLVRGAELLIDDQGREHSVLRPVVAVCRCGTTTHPPWCDGMHKLLQRRDRDTATP